MNEILNFSELLWSLFCIQLTILKKWKNPNTKSIFWNSTNTKSSWFNQPKSQHHHHYSYHDDNYHSNISLASFHSTTIKVSTLTEKIVCYHLMKNLGLDRKHWFWHFYHHKLFLWFMIINRLNWAKTVEDSWSALVCPGLVEQRKVYCSE